MEALRPEIAKLILQEHLRQRMCPPPDRVSANELDEHLTLCPLCKDWVYIFRNFSYSHTSFPHSHPSEVDVGQIWRINSDLSGWEDGKEIYYNPVCVMVIYKWGEIARVAVVHDEDILATLEDVPFRGLFIEPWNTFSIPLNRLESFIVDASDVLDIVRERAQSGVMPEPTSSIEETFINAEIGVASYFASRVLEEVMQLEQASDLLDTIAWEDDETLFPFLNPDASGSSLITRLAAYQPPGTMLPLAAAGEEDPGEPIVINIVEFKNDKPSFRTTRGYLTFKGQKGDQLVFGGKIQEPLSPNAGIHAVLIDKVTGTIIMPAMEASLDTTEGFFQIVFSPVTDDDAKRGKLGVLVGTH